MESNRNINHVALTEVRKELTARLIRTWGFTEADLAPRSVYQLVTLIHLLAGHRNYVGQHTTTCYTLERISGEVIYDEPLIEPKAEPESAAESTQVVTSIHRRNLDTTRGLGVNSSQ